MVVHLVASDEGLQTLARDVANQLATTGQPWVVESSGCKESSCEADLHLWNYHTGLSLPRGVDWNPLRHIFIVEPADLNELREQIGAGATILVNPVSRGAMTAFFSAAWALQDATSLREERDAILQCLIQTNLKLQEHDHERTIMLARAVHDLRAPLGALSGYCGLLLSEALGPLRASQDEVVRRMHNSARRLSRIATAIAEVGGVEPPAERRTELQPADLRDCVQQALEDVAPYADEKSITITVDIDASGEGLYFESAQLEQALMHLLDNACRFTPRAGEIEIRGYPFFWERRNGRRQSATFTADRRRFVTREPNSYRVDIADSGMPIAPDRLETIFEEYTSTDAECDRSGGGLGLAICKRIVAQHRGRIWAENRETGAVFSFVLPIHRSGSTIPGFCGAGRGARDLRGTVDAN